jgi:hypothetical protein
LSNYDAHTWTNLPSETTKINATRLSEMDIGIETRVGSVNGVDPDGSGNVDVAAATAVTNGLIRLTGVLSGTATSPTLSATLNDPAAATPGLRTLGTGAVQAAAGNHNHDTAYVPLARTVSAGSGLTGGGDLSANRTLALAIVPNPPVTLTYAASLTPDASAGNYRVCTMTGAATLFAPTSPTDGQVMRIRFIASGAQRIVTFDSGLKRSSPLGTTLTIASGKRGDVQMIYESTDGWTVLTAAAQV